jgi:Glycosyl transferase family 2
VPPSQQRRESISACIIARDEEARLPEALASVSFCDEVIVVDGGSTDDTIAIARAAGAIVVENPWPGFAAQRNVAIDHATSDWIVEIDADERVSPELREEIERFLADPPPHIDMGALPIRNAFLGRPISQSARYPAYRYRLFRRTAYRHDETRVVHEGLWSNGAVWPFEGDLRHVLAGSLAEAWADAVAYARLEARQIEVPLTPGTVAKGVVARPFVKFVYRTAVLEGWRDGWRGLVKVSLDCLTDATVVLLSATRREPLEHAHHWGAGSPLAVRGPVRIVGIALGDEAEPAEAWLARAAAAGADVSMIADRPGSVSGVRVHRLPSRTFRKLVQALDSENQLRNYDALLPAGPSSQRLVRHAPRALRGRVSPLALERAPEEAVSELAAATRGPGASTDTLSTLGSP